MANNQKRRGEVWWINFDPSIGSEIQKLRPAVILSNNRSNRVLTRYQVVPLSSQVDKLYPAEVRVQINGRVSKAMADQLTTVSDQRCVSKLGELDAAQIVVVEGVVKFQLGLIAATPT